LILLAPHFVALDLGGMALALHYTHRFSNGYVTMYRAPKNRLLDQLIRRGRLRFGGRLVERHDGIKPVLRELKRGTPLYYLPDQDPGRRGTVFAPFFGVPAATLTTVSRIVGMTNAVVMPFFARLLPGGRGIEAIFNAPLDNFPSGDDVADATRVNAVIEDGVRLMPEHYFWVHKRFKTRPEGMPSIYRS
jgi:KDO2-lipid IV(A) lauroyltransferase